MKYLATLQAVDTLKALGCQSGLSRHLQNIFTFQRAPTKAYGWGVIATTVRWVSFGP